MSIDNPFLNQFIYRRSFGQSCLLKSTIIKRVLSPCLTEYTTARYLQECSFKNTCPSRLMSYKWKTIIVSVLFFNSTFRPRDIYNQKRCLSPCVFNILVNILLRNRLFQFSLFSSNNNNCFAIDCMVSKL